jgi:protein CpxP
MAMLPLRQLGLSDAQQQQVRQLMQQYREQTRTLADQVRAAEDARRTAVETVPVDEGRIRAAMQQLLDRQTELAIRRARLQSDIRALLTSEQQQQLEKLRAEREARFKQRQERFRERQRNQA